MKVLQHDNTMETRHSEWGLYRRLYILLYSTIQYYRLTTGTRGAVTWSSDHTQQHTWLGKNTLSAGKSAYERATRVRACNYVKIKTGWNFPPVLKIETRTAQAA